VRRLETSEEDYFPGLTSEQKKDKLSRMSYKKFLLDVVKVDPRVIPIYQTRTHPLFGVGIDAVAALDCWALQMPGFKGLKLEPGPYRRMGYTPMGSRRTAPRQSPIAPVARSAGDTWFDPATARGHRHRASGLRKTSTTTDRLFP